MSVGTVGSNNNVAMQKSKAVDEAKSTDAATAETKQATATPDATATVQASQETQDATRQMQKAGEGSVRQNLEQGWDEARGRSRGGRGGRTRAEGPSVTRGLTQFA